MTMVFQDKNIRIDTKENGEQFIANAPHIFSAMIQYTQGIMESYFSDLYHDALFVSRIPAQEQGWWYCVGKNGTNIAVTRDDAKLCAKHGRPYVFHCALTRDNKRDDYLTFTITPEP